MGVERMEERTWVKAVFVVVITALLMTGIVTPVLAAEEDGSGGSIWVIVFLAAIWIAILAAILITVFRIRRRERKEEEEGVEFTSKEH